MSSFNTSLIAALATALAAAPAGETRWSLSTEDTVLHLLVANHKILLEVLRNPTHDWNWVPMRSEVPLPSVRTDKGEMTPDWNFVEAKEDRADGHALTLCFVSTNPKLELKSVWRALAGPGPVENQVTIENRSGRPVTFSPGIAAARIRLKADSSVVLHRAEKTAAGKGRVYEDALEPQAQFSTGSGIIPLIILAAGTTHGVYLGFEWELGGFQVAAGADPLDITASVHPITEEVTRHHGETFLIPSTYYGVYRGDIDDGSNRFKRWFWNHKITRSLHDNPDEPWTEVCMQVIGGNGSSVTGETPQSAYDALAATGVELVKMDFWDGTGKCWYTGRDWTFHPEVWPRGFDFAAKAHRAGLKASLYMGGTYRDCDLTTLAGRDLELAAVLERYDQGWFDMWRTDRYTAPMDPMPSTYQGVTNFLFIQDQLIKSRPGYRYENCCNGGKFKGFAICRRMTFCTMNDIDRDPVATRTTYYSNSFAINPVQLKSDLGPALDAYHLRTDMLGSILTWAADNPVYRLHIALYKARQRPILRGADVYHILPMPNGVDWDGLQFHNSLLDKGSVFLFKPSAKASDGDSKVIRLKGLDRKANYTLSFQDRKHLNAVLTGAQLMDQGITVSGMTGDGASEIIWINCWDLSVSPGDLRFTVDAQGGPGQQDLAIAWNGPRRAEPFTVAADAPWVGVTPVAGSGDGQKVRITVDLKGKPSGIYRAQVVVSRGDLTDRCLCPLVVRVQGEPRPASIAVSSEERKVISGARLRVRAVVRDQFDEPHAGPVAWRVSGGGTIDASGLFQSDGTLGEVTVTGAVQGHPPVTGAAKFTVVSDRIARWKLDETKGTSVADAWGGHTGTLVGPAAWVRGKRGGGVQFSKPGQYVDTHTSLLDLKLPITIAFWVNPAAPPTEDADTEAEGDLQAPEPPPEGPPPSIFGNRTETTLGMAFQQHGTTANQYAFTYGSPPAPGGAGPVPLKHGTWQHVAVVCDGTAVLVYHNGAVVARGKGAHPLTPNPAMTFRLGHGCGGERFFNGALDDFRIYARVLSAAEVAELVRETDPIKE